MLNAAYEAAMAINIEAFGKFLAGLSSSPMSMIGSGGSFSSATFASELHEMFFGQVARAVTPLDILERPDTAGGAICFSASGRNRDIGAAFKALCLAEAGPVGALVLASNTPLHALGRQYDSSQVNSADNPAFKDGFLAVASIIASGVLLIRAYETASGQTPTLPSSLNDLLQEILRGRSLTSISECAEACLHRDTTSLIFSPPLRSAAVDLESRFVEAALGNLHIADLRNFGHGRHHWIAKRQSETSVIALVSDQWSVLADRTLALIPEDVPLLRVDVTGPPSHQALVGLVVGLYISLAAGRTTGIDPGKPGVPEFGRKLYRLGPGTVRIKQNEANKRAAIKRKAPAEDLRDIIRAEQWGEAYETIWASIQNQKISGIVFDYDGTLCRMDRRYEPLRQDVTSQLLRLIKSGLKIGVATGRGPSAGLRLREALPREYWSGVTIGYYNGGAVTCLADSRDPIANLRDPDPLASALLGDAVFTGCEIRPNTTQISIRLTPSTPTALAETVVRRLASDLCEQVSIVSSGHSLDVLRVGQSKSDVVHALSVVTEQMGGVILRIGDRGAWPGNDAEFLDCELGLSVDKASSHMRRCWNLAPAGIRGVQATLYYLNALSVDEGVGTLRFKKGDKGAPRET